MNNERLKPWFRGKSVRTGKWAYGYYTVEHMRTFDCHWIYDPENDERYQVHEETVTQYVGTDDLNGKKVFEGDILKSDWGYSGTVELDTFMYAKLECTVSEKIEVVGNVFDNQNFQGGSHEDI